MVGSLRMRVIGEDTSLPIDNGLRVDGGCSLLLIDPTKKLGAKSEK